MTKTERLRRDRADRRELRALQSYKSSIQYYGLRIGQLNLSEITDAKLGVASDLECDIVLKRASGTTWNIRAVKR